MPLQVMVEEVSDEPQEPPEVGRAPPEAGPQGKKGNLALERSFDEESALPPEPPPLERSHPASATSAECKHEKVAGTPAKKLDAEERLQRKREAQRRYYLKIRGQTLADAREGRKEKSQPALEGPFQPEHLGQRKATVGEVAPQSRRPSKQKPPAEATEENAYEDAETPRPPPLETKAESLQFAPPDIRLATPQLRSRALLRSNYDQRAQRFAGLLAKGLPA